MKKFIYVYILLTFFVIGFLLYTVSYSFNMYYKYQCSKNPTLGEEDVSKKEMNIRSCFLYNNWGDDAAKVINSFK